MNDQLIDERIPTPTVKEGRYYQSLCLGCCRTNHDVSKMRCKDCKGVIVLVHEEDTTEGRAKVESEVKSWTKDFDRRLAFTNSVISGVRIVEGLPRTVPNLSGDEATVDMNGYSHRSKQAG